MSPITAILTAYRRPALLRPQVKAVRAQSVAPRAVWLWVNDPDECMRKEIDALAVDRVVVCSDNAHVHARFALALTATTEFVAVFDDDALPGTNWFANCLRTMQQTPGILGSAGVRLAGVSYRNGDRFGWHTPCAQTVEVDLVGHAWFLRTEWVKYLFFAPAVVGSNGEDIELAARAWRLGQVRCFCPPHPPEDRSLWGSLHGIEHGSDAVAASRRPAHLDERDQVVRAEIAAGWKPLCLRPGTAPGRQPPPAVRSSPQLARPVTHMALLDMLPPGSRRILDLGCEDGYLREGLRNRSWFGERYQAVLLADVADYDCAPASFDCIVLHRPETLADPERLLRQARDWLRPDGTLFVQFPTARHHGLVSALLQGQWGPERPWHPGHERVRLFTRREAEKLLYRAGYAVAEVQALPGEGYEEWAERGRPGEVRVGALHVSGLPEEDAEEFHAWGYLCRALPVADTDFGLTSLVLVTHNELAYTRLCVDSIRLRTDEPYELIFVDNGSSDGTLDYLRTLEGATLLRNKDNRGFPAAANQGLRAARGQQVLLLNNDTVVTTGWLGRMLRVLHSDPGIGLVGPCSNQVSGEQQVGVTYETLEDLDGFAWDWGKEHGGARADTDRLVGFCLLIRRAALEAVGLLDERFGIGCFDDDDYCLRVRRAGFRAVIAGDAFVHHFGGRTFVGSGVDFAGLMRRNQRLFEEKWSGKEATAGTAVASSAAPVYSAREAEGGGLVLVREEIAASLVMIVRNNARTIGPALEGIRKFLPDMVVVDTGSTDETPQIAERLGARVFRFPWCDSFSTARNESLRHARGRWIFWMDSDDTIDDANGRGLRELLRRPAPPNVLGYVVSVHCPGADPDDPAGFTRVTHVKLFRNLPSLRFEGRIHEQILPAIQRAGGEVEFTPLFVVHSGYDHSPEGQRHKLARDLRLLHLELREQPEHPFTLFNLGMTYFDASRYREAVVFLERCLARSGERSSHVRKAHAYLVSCRQQLRDGRGAWQACARGLASFPLDAELRFRRAMLLHDRGLLAEAATVYQDLLTRREEEHFTSVSEGVSGYLARYNLARVYQDLGDRDRAGEQWRLILADRPKYRPAQEALEEIGHSHGATTPRQASFRRCYPVA